MEPMDLNQLFGALQDQILSLYEEENTDLASQLRHWQLQRKSNAVAYYARKQGLKRLGMQPTPSLASSEAQGKQAVEMTIYIKSLLDSPFANESWTLQDTSAELVLHTAPQRTFKKLPYTVDVWFDNDAANSMQYVSYRLIYARDADEHWYKTEGQVDYDGLFFIDYNGDKAYFKLFAGDAQTYGTSGKWSVHYNNTTLFPPTSSSRPTPGSSVIVIDSDEDTPGPSSNAVQYSTAGQESARSIYSSQSEEETQGTGRGAPKSPQATGVRQQGERRTPGSPAVKRAKADSSGGDRRRRGARGGTGTGGGGGGSRGSARGSPPTASEVGSRHFSVTERGLNKLERLQAEARDPAIIIVEGPANCLKCWRHRLKKYNEYFRSATTVFKWISCTYETQNSRILISFYSESQRHKFLTFVKIPRNCKYNLGRLDAL